MKRIGQAVSIGVVALKIQGKNFYEFNIQHFDLKKGRAVLELVLFKIIVNTVLFGVL